MSIVGYVKKPILCVITDTNKRCDVLAINYDCCCGAGGGFRLKREQSRDLGRRRCALILRILICGLLSYLLISLSSKLGICHKAWQPVSGICSQYSSAVSTWFYPVTVASSIDILSSMLYSTIGPLFQPGPDSSLLCHPCSMN